MSKNQSEKQIPIKDIICLEDMPPDICRTVIQYRIQLDLQETKHPFHHKTADGTIVDADPTLEYLISRLTDATETVPVDKNYYQRKNRIKYSIFAKTGEIPK
jgi:hypothetical protein